ncbi:DoxX family protein [Chryseobacterium gleum]|uniref:DoxX family protein n=1 Tax=Chryseobacterium TaxID=59732 RepID=UPI0028AE0B82|nr:DoxX family protein [Chryseobacterium gleum]
MNKINSLNSINNHSLAILIQRLSIGGLMLFHGFYKLSHGVNWIAEMLVAKGLPGFIAYGSYIGEIVAPIMIILGVKTRIVSAILAATLFNAFLLMHLSDFFLTNPTSGGWQIELILLYFLGAITLIITGGGKYALTSKTKYD